MWYIFKSSQIPYLHTLFHWKQFIHLNDILQRFLEEIRSYDSGPCRQPSLGVRLHWTLMYLNCSPENILKKKKSIDLLLNRRYFQKLKYSNQPHCYEMLPPTAFPAAAEALLPWAGNVPKSCFPFFAKTAYQLSDWPHITENHTISWYSKSLLFSFSLSTSEEVWLDLREHFFKDVLLPQTDKAAKEN